MGRPIKKKFFGNKPNALTPVMYYRKDALEPTYFGAYIKKQKNSRRYLISATDNSWSEVMTLVNKPLLNLEPGEFSMPFHIENSYDNFYPKKINGRTFVAETNDRTPVPVKYKWSFESVRLPMDFWETWPTLSSFSTFLLYPSGVSIGSVIRLEGTLPQLDNIPFTVTALITTEADEGNLSAISVTTGIAIAEYQFGVAEEDPAGYITIITPRPVAKL
jgi:hypothetical protein